MSKLEIVSSRHDDLSRWGSRTFSLPELIPEVRELGLVGPLVNPESLPVSHRITHNIHITGQCKKKGREMKKVPALFSSWIAIASSRRGAPLFCFFCFFLFFFFLNLETWLLRGLLFLARLRREASWGLRGTKAGGGWRIIISFPCLFNDIFILSFTFLFCNILVHNRLILMYFQKILSILFFLVTITF